MKKDGVWLKPLKFLGLQYDPFTKSLTARTRKGSTLRYDKEDLLRMVNERDLGIAPESTLKKTEKVDSWETLVKSRLAGFIQSRLYQGD